MKVCQRIVCLCIWTVLACLWGMAVHGTGFSPMLSVSEELPGAVVEVCFPYDGSLEKPAAFRTQVEYDPQAFEYLRPTYGESLQEGTVTTRAEEGLVSSVYTAPGEGPYPAEEVAVTYRFRVLENALPGSYRFFASVFELSDSEPSPLGGDVDVPLAFQVLPPPSQDAGLLSLVPDHGTLRPAFSPDVFQYAMTVPYEVDAVLFTAEPAAGASCRVNRKNLGPGGSDTLFTITVTAEDGETRRVYQVTVHREEKKVEPLSGDARLLSLKPAAGTLSPAFDPEVLEYTLTVPYEVATMTFDAQPVKGASYRVNRKNLGPGGRDTLFTITVTAEVGETRRVYQVTVHREEKKEEPLSADARLLSLTPETGTLDPGFDPEVLEYTLTVPYEVASMTFEAQPAEGASYRVNRKNLGGGGSDTLFTVTVTAADRETKRVYQITVHREEKAPGFAAIAAESHSSGVAGGESSFEAAAPSQEELPDEEPPVSHASTEEVPEPAPAQTTSAASEKGGLVVQNGSPLLLPGMLVMVAFVLFCFLSGPLSKWLSRRFFKEDPKGSEQEGKPKE